MYYLAGPMTGYPQFNYPLFDDVAQILRADGYDIVSPAEMDSPETREAAMASPDGVLTKEFATGETWGDFLSRDVKLIADKCDGIILLPNWWKSAGARLETFVAVSKKIPVMLYEIQHGQDDPSCADLRGPMKLEWILQHITAGIKEANNG